MNLTFMDDLIVFAQNTPELASLIRADYQKYKKFVL